MQLLGEALSALRARSGKSQEAAAREIGQSKQSWQAYEAGRRQAILRTDLQDRLTHALGATREDLIRERAVLAGETPVSVAFGVEDRTLGAWEFVRPVVGRARAGIEGPAVFATEAPDEYVDLRDLFGPEVRFTRVAGESVTGYADDGSLVYYNDRRLPRRGKGAVVKLESGELLVKIFKEIRAGTLYLEELHPERRTIEIAMDKVLEVNAVVGRDA